MINTLSDPCLITFGIPQGTILGPILFNFYINSLTKLDDNGKILSYADNIVIVFKGTSCQEVKRNAKLGIELVKRWLDMQKFSLNVKNLPILRLQKLM